MHSAPGGTRTRTHAEADRGSACAASKASRPARTAISGRSTSRLRHAAGGIYQQSRHRRSRCRCFKDGATVVGAAPNDDTDMGGRILACVFEMAREFDNRYRDATVVAAPPPRKLDTLLVCELTEKYGGGGGVVIWHAEKSAPTREPVTD